MFIILQIFFATSGISQAVICQHVKVCQLASKTASFNIHFHNFEQTSLQLKEYAWEKVQHFSERKTYFLCGYKWPWRIRFTNSLPSKLTAYEVDFLVFSGTALSTCRFISSSVTKANRSAILTLILM